MKWFYIKKKVKILMRYVLTKFYNLDVLKHYLNLTNAR